LAACSLWATCSTAQELSPRAYWPAPKGTKVAVFGYSYSFGDVATDPAVPIFGVDSKINVGFFGYLQTLSLWGRTANVLVELPYIWGTSKGIVEGVPRRRDVSGVGDIGVTLSVNLLGAPSMTPREFLEFRESPRPILGASVKVVGPTGEYEKDKLINVGANRWAVKAELGYVIPVRGRWLLELELGGWIFGDNDDFLGVTRGQRAVGAAEIHFVRRFNPGFWASLDFNYFWGGRSIVGGQLRQDSQRNSRLGGTVVVPFLGRHAVAHAAVFLGLLDPSAQCLGNTADLGCNGRYRARLRFI
jgi:hypothetical protein